MTAIASPAQQRAMLLLERQQETPRPRTNQGAGTASGGSSRQRQLSPQLHTPVLLLYLSALYQAGVVYELSGCAEDAIAALRECSRLSLPTSPTAHALAACLLCRISRKQGDACRAARYLEEALRSCPQAGASADCSDSALRAWPDAVGCPQSQQTTVRLL